ncbi:MULTISPECIES: hypothetical protein [unclassified Nonomuraea]|uniref:effector-associated constant component EACC1 n=1 Tax=unclassified Nonomuraea TaxID=2593643 RepID=UPI0033D9E8CE
MQVIVRLDSETPTAPALSALERQLRGDSAFRGMEIRPLPGPPEPGAMNGTADALMLAVSAASGGLGVSIVQALAGWLRTRRHSFTVKVSHGERTLELSVEAARDPAKVMEVARQLAEMLEPPAP